MSTKQQTENHTRYLEERIQYLEEINRFVLDALEMAASLGDFQTSINKLQEPSVILHETRSRIQRLIQFQALAFFLVDETDNDFFLASCEPEDCSSYVKNEVDFLIDNGTFAWTLREKRPVIVSSKNYKRQIVLHVMATSSRVRGIFIGLLEKGKTNISDMSLSLLSIILLNSSNALESFELYKMIREINENLEKKENYRTLFEAAPDGVEVLDARGNVVDCNKTHQVLLGYSHEDIVGNHTTAFFSDKNKASFKKRLPILKETGLAEGEIELVRSDGSIIPVWRKEKGIYNGNMEFVGSVVYNRDISNHKRAEEEKKKLEIQLQQAQKMQAIGTLAGGIAHDFNNILFPIIGYTEMAIDDVPEEGVTRSNLGEVLKAANRAKGLVQQILTFSRQSEQERKPLKIQSIIKETLKLLRASLPSTIEITQNIDKECRPTMADPTQIHQVLMNLCTNAYHAMHEKGGVLGVTLTEVDIDSGDLTSDLDPNPGPYLKLVVSDTGHGMERLVMERIFDPYFTTKGPAEGIGMGLAVVHGIVRSHGGYITVYSEPGKGTAFHVYLPRIESGAILSETVSTELTPKGKEHILIVDDEEQIVHMVRLLLESIGYHVTARTSSVEALEAFHTQPERFDLVITDQTMPNMTGTELAQKLMGIRSDIPIILFTGFSEVITEEKAKSIGIREYVMKPIVKIEIARTIRRVLDREKDK